MRGQFHLGTAGVLDGVADQVQQHLPHTDMVGVHAADVRRTFEHNPVAVFAGHLDGFDHKIQLFKTQKVDGEAVQGVMGA